MGTRIMAAVFFGLACVLVFGAPAAVSTDTLGDPGPDLLPRIVGICMGLLAVLLFFRVSLEPSSIGTGENPVQISLSLVAIPAFYLAFEYLGYTMAVGLYLFAAFCLLGLGTRAARFRYALVAIAFSLTSGMVFARLLDLPLAGVMP